MKYLWITLLLFGVYFFASCQRTNGPKEEVKIKQSGPEDTPKRYVKLKSENSFNETYSRLKEAIEKKKPLKIIAELDHSANAKRAGLELGPTKIIMFGNPKLGTPLMKANQEVGIDLPQKMLVYENVNSEVFVVYTEPSVVIKAHKTTNIEVANKISSALNNLAEAAITK